MTPSLRSCIVMRCVTVFQTSSPCSLIWLIFLMRPEQLHRSWFLGLVRIKPCVKTWRAVWQQLIRNHPDKVHVTIGWTTGSLTIPSTSARPMPWGPLWRFTTNTSSISSTSSLSVSSSFSLFSSSSLPVFCSVSPSMFPVFLSADAMAEETNREPSRHFTAQTLLVTIRTIHRWHVSRNHF